MLKCGRFSNEVSSLDINPYTLYCSNVSQHSFLKIDLKSHRRTKPNFEQWKIPPDIYQNLK
jgi:hypothetical protein